MRVTLYTKPQCPLCEEAEEVIESVVASNELAVFDITDQVLDENGVAVPETV